MNKDEKHLKLGAKKLHVKKTQVQKYHENEVFSKNILNFGKKLKKRSKY